MNVDSVKPILCPDEPMVEKINLNHDSNILVICGCCNKSMPTMEYEKKHKPIHNNLCWIKGDKKLDFDDENATINLLRQFSPKNATRNRKVKLTCEWCQTTKKSILGFASHVKQCQLRPDKKSNTTGKSDIEISSERDNSMVTCGRCIKEMTFKEYRTKHCSIHYNLCWIVGEEKLNLENYVDVWNILKKFVSFKDVRNRTLNLTCEDCKSVKKSIAGFASHVIFCNKTDNVKHQLLMKCEDCGNKVKPSSYAYHKLKSCKGNPSMNNGDDSNENQSSNVVSESLSYKLRRKRRPPNILSFHPDTKYAAEFYDSVCCLCNFIAPCVEDIITHVINFHNIDINNIDNTNNLDGYILNPYDVYKDILYLKPFLNYYNFYRKTFWTATFHEDFQSDILHLNTDEALKYLPSIQQSCKIFSSDDKEICVDLFKSTYINDMFWLFTGGPNWAMSWCPVPEQIQTQYLAISCHPNPDFVHKEMDIYKYPSLVQLWTFDSLSNIDYKFCSDMPYMSYGLAHEFGAVWDMAWCPSGAYEPNKKIGLLALSTSCGDCPVFAMPHIVEYPETFSIYKLKPVIARNFECEWVENGVQCTKVCWKAVPPFKTLICGYSNGMVSIFNIHFNSIFLNGDILYPSQTFRASRSSITGLSMDYLNSSILATAGTDGYIILWDLNSTENPIFQKKSYTPSDCTWIQQCHTLVYCNKCVNPIFLKVRTINFSTCEDDVYDYNPALYIMKNMSNSRKVISNYNVVKNDEKLNCDMKNFDNSDETIEHKSNTNNKSTTHSDFNTNSDNESSKNNDEKSSDEFGDAPENIEEEDYYGPTFFQKSIHWSVSGSNWMNVIATGDANGVIYEKLFLPETNKMKKANSTTLQVMVKKLLNETSQSEFSNGYDFKDTVKEFGLKSTFFPCEMTNLRSDPDDSKPLLRYPLENITKVSWNQNFSSFRWLGIGTQSGFTLVSPSQAISDNYFKSFYKIVLTTNNVDFDNVKCKTESADISM